jgi:aspartyl/asparaginyl beta-hydroxylase (cupin superfamily)
MPAGSDGEEEMVALNKVLAAEPRNLQALARAAALHETRGAPRTAAAIWRTVLQSIPAGAVLPPEIRSLVGKARSAIDANNLALETFLEARLKDLRARHADEPLGRFDKSLSTLLLRRRVYRPQPSFMYFPQLPAIEFYERADFPWLDSIEAATGEIRAELMAVLANDPEGLTPYISLPGRVNGTWRELNNSPRWRSYFLWREGVEYADNTARCPRTVAALGTWPRCDLPGCAPTAMFSILDAKSRIPPHTGVNNCRLVVHLPLVVPRDCGFRVGAEKRGWELGCAFVFDDTIEHEAWNDSDEWRAVLILDIWNPYLSAAEREMVCALTAGVDEFYGTLPPYIHPAQKTP